MLVGGCLLVGVGIGMVIGYPAPGATIGLGIGLILEHLVSRNRLSSSEEETSQTKNDEG